MPTGHVDTGYFISGNPETAPVLITGAQPKPGTGHKMQSVPVVFERYIVRDISLTYFWKCSLAHLNLEKHEVAFGGKTLTMH